MTDDLNDLKAMMDSATPRPDAARRAENLALAQKNFADLQGSRTAPRPTPATEAKGLWTGVKTMLNAMTSKGALTTTTAIVAVGFLVLTPQMQDVLRPPSEPQITMTEFNGTIREPLIESEVTSDMTTQATPLTARSEEVLQEPLVMPDQDVALAAPKPAPEMRGRNIDEVPQAPLTVPPQESEAQNSITPEKTEPDPQTAISQFEGDAANFPFGESVPSAPPESALRQLQPIEQAEAALGIGLGSILDENNHWTSAGDMEAEGTGEPVLRGNISVGDAAANIATASESEWSEQTPPVMFESMAIAPPTDNVAEQPQTSEAFPTEAPNDLKITSEEPVSTFSIDVDTAAYSVVRSSLSRGQLPPIQAVRIEELINYFPYDYPAPDAGEAPFRPTVSTFATPWNADTQLVHIALQGQKPALDDRPPLNLVFLIDTSGSMDDPTKLPLLKQSFRLMLDQLRPEDEVAIVEYAGSAGQVLAPTAASERTTILNAIQSLGAGGSTNGQGGLQQAYAVADGMKTDGEVSRIILATDGDFNVGLSNPDALKDFIADKRGTGTYLSVLGFGRGNLDDATMQSLAQNGNGTAAYIDTLSEAQKVLVDQLSGALFPIAGDVKVQVEFNPAQVAEYRLIGYETRSLNREDFNNDRVDAGELGAGHSVTAIYEITPVGSPAQLSDPLRYAPNTVAASSDELGYIKLRYKEPGDDVSQLIETPIAGNIIPGTEASFAAAIAGFGQLLRDDSHLGDWGYDDAIALANSHRGDDPFGYRTEAVQLMRLAQSLSR